MDRGRIAEILFTAPRESRTSDANQEVPGQILAEAFGRPNVVGSHSPTLSIHLATNLVHGQHPEHVSDLQHCYYLITPVGAWIPTRQWLEQHSVGTRSAHDTLGGYLLLKR